jgi:hypothetical protein
MPARLSDNGEGGGWFRGAATLSGIASVAKVTAALKARSREVKPLQEYF